jgi:lipoyl-dependent peroxiredoxin
MRVLGTETVSAALTGPDRPPEVATDAHGVQVTLALPPGFGGTERAGTTNPEQLFGSAYTGCFVFAVEYAARRTSSDVSGLRCTAEVRVGRGRDGGNDLEVDLVVDLPALDQAEAEAVCERAERYCPFHRAIHGNVPTTLTVRGRGAATTAPVASAEPVEPPAAQRPGS